MKQMALHAHLGSSGGTQDDDPGVPDLDRIANEVGTPHFLGKPYHLAQLVALVDRALVERQPPRCVVTG